MSSLPDPMRDIIRPHQQDKQITTCKVCGYGVFRHHDYGFYRRPLGMSHTACVQRLETT